MQKYKLTIITLLFFGCFMLFPFKAKSQTNKLQCSFLDSTSFVFSYKSQSGLLLKEYIKNKKSFGKMDLFISCCCDNILAGKAHLAITSYIKPSDLTSPQVLNTASIQASVARAYIKVKYNIDHEYVTFAFDTVHNIERKIRVMYVEAPISKLENKEIYYTLDKDSAAIVNYYKLCNPFDLVEPKPTLDSLSLHSTYVIKSIDEMVVPQFNNEIEFTQVIDPKLAIKTNLLYWAGVIPKVNYRYVTPNIELEYYFLKRFSVNVDGAYTYMAKDNAEQETWAASSIGVEPRIWLKSDNSFSGLYAGVYGLLGSFDVKLNKMSNIGYTGLFNEAGLSLGYYLPLSSRWGIEAGARYGFRKVNSDAYTSIPLKKDHFLYQFSSTSNNFQFTGLRLIVSYRLGTITTNK